jgi:hypothetical protein
LASGQKRCRADLHRGGAERQGGDDATRIGDAAGGDDRHLDCVDDLRDQAKVPAGGDVVGQEHAAMVPASCLRDDGIAAALGQPLRLRRRGRTRSLATGGADARQQRRRGQAEVEAHDLRRIPRRRRRSCRRAACG